MLTGHPCRKANAAAADCASRSAEDEVNRHEVIGGEKDFSLWHAILCFEEQWLGNKIGRARSTHITRQG